MSVRLVQPISEARAIAPLLLDRQFCAFYQAERPKIHEPLYWDVAPALIPPWYEAACRVVPGLPTIIRLREVPRPDQGWLVAHELLHAVLASEGFPFVWAPSPWLEPLVFFMNVVEDLLIADRLVAYGFDACAFFQGRAAVALRTFTSSPLLRGPEVGIAAACIYATLCWEAAYVERWSAQEPDTRARDLFAAGYPTWARLGRALMQLALRCGRQTPAQVRSLYGAALDIFGLGGIGLVV